MPLIIEGGAQSLTFSKDPKLGIVAVKLRCTADTLSEAISGAAPEIGVAGLIENQPRTCERDAAGEVGGYHVNITLEGHSNPEEANGEEFELNSTLADDPIETHRNLDVLLHVYRGKIDRNTHHVAFEYALQDQAGSTGGWVDSSPFLDVASGGFTSSNNSGSLVTASLLGNGANSVERRNPLFGVETFRNPGLIWSRRRASKTLPSNLVSSLGRIDIPPGNPPELSGNRNWLKIRVTARERGNIWEIQEFWELSDVGGWILEVYQ